jgi:O-acetyl-ADP-ribose deacetylase (regulator of RNase III)
VQRRIILLEHKIRGRTLRLRQGDITTVPADVLVNAANSALAGGGGVDGAIHRAGGPSIMAACRVIGGCPTGDAVVTGAGNLSARYVIHAVAPVWKGGTQAEAELLRNAYRRSLEQADAVGARSVSFPSLGTGAYRFPLNLAADIAISTVLGYLTGNTALDEVIFVLFSESDLQAYETTLQRQISEHPHGYLPEATDTFSEHF